MSCSRGCFKMHCSNCGVAKGLNTIPPFPVSGTFYIVHIRENSLFSRIPPHQFTHTHTNTYRMHGIKHFSKWHIHSFVLFAHPITYSINIYQPPAVCFSVLKTKPKWTNAKSVEQMKMLQRMINRQLCVISRSLECNLMLVFSAQMLVQFQTS